MKPSGKIVIVAVLTSLALASQGQPAFEPKGNATDEALARYAELTDTTILRSSSLGVLKSSATADLPTDTNAAAAALKNALLAQGIELVPFRGLFTIAVPPGWSNSPLKELIARLPTEGVEEQPQRAGTTGPGGEIIPPGMIDFMNADLNQVLQLYAELCNKTLLRPTQLPMPQVRLKTQTPVSKNAAIYAVRASLALQGIGTVEVGEKLVAVLLVDRVATFTPPEPKPVSDDSVVSLSDIPQFRMAPAQQLVDYYAQLVEKTAAAAAELGQSKVLFRAQTPLKKSELVQALETVLALNGLAIVQPDDKTIRLDRVQHASKRK